VRNYDPGVDDLQESHFDTTPQRENLLRLVPEDELLRTDLQMLWEWYDRLVDQERSIRKRLVE
jgi:hypothetical protein